MTSIVYDTNPLCTPKLINKVKLMIGLSFHSRKPITSLHTHHPRVNIPPNPKQDLKYPKVKSQTN